MKMFASILLLLASFTLSIQLIAAEAAPPTPPPAPGAKLRVLVKPAEPFSFEKNGEINGFSVDLWKRVAEDAGLQFEMKMVKTVPEVLTALQKGEADVGVGALSITQEREKILDFSHPFFESGLQILAPGESNSSPFAAFGALFRGDVLKVIGLFLLAIFVVSNFLWLAERKRNSDSFPEAYKPGIWEASWWATSTIISGGCENKAAISPAGRLIAVVWMLGGIGLTSYITATLASAMTVNTLTSKIQNISDLKGLAIGTVTGSSSDTFLKSQGFNPKGYADLSSSIDALNKGDLKAVIYDSPMLRYYLASHADSTLQLAGDIIEPQNYGFALPLDSPQRKRINESLLKLQREGFRAALEKKWFSNGKAE